MAFCWILVVYIGIIVYVGVVYILVGNTKKTKICTTPTHNDTDENYQKPTGIHSNNNQPGHNYITRLNKQDGYG